MKNQELFDRTVGILVKAYMNNTLEHQYCAACAVGNIVAANMGYKTEPKSSYFKDGIDTAWTECSFNGKPRTMYLNQMSKLAQDQIKSTGYTPYQLHLIEKAFEKVLHLDEDLNNFDDYWYSGDKEYIASKMFDGLISVVDCLSEIHEASTTETSAAKQLFSQPT